MPQRQQGGGAYGHQDWAPQVGHTGPERVHATHDNRSVNSALQKGQKVEVTSKIGSGGNQHHRMDHQHERKIANSDDTYVHKKVDHDVSVNIRRARAKKEMTQQQLAMAINERVTVIQQYESGNAIPDGRLISQMERALGMRLRGANALEPFEERKPKK